jgi:hypothetical protein
MHGVRDVARLRSNASTPKLQMNENFGHWGVPPESAAPRWFQDRGRAFKKIIRDILAEEGLAPRTKHSTPVGRRLTAPTFGAR